MSISIKTCILAYLGGVAGWTWGGTLAREIARECQCKESVAERRARELQETGLLDHEYIQVNGEGPKCVRYRLHKDTPATLEL